MAGRGYRNESRREEYDEGRGLKENDCEETLMAKQPESIFGYPKGSQNYKVFMKHFKGREDEIKNAYVQTTSFKDGEYVDKVLNDPKKEKKTKANKKA